jgi:hypothetical protein
MRTGRDHARDQGRPSSGPYRFAHSYSAVLFGFSYDVLLQDFNSKRRAKLLNPDLQWVGGLNRRYMGVFAGGAAHLYR